MSGNDIKVDRKSKKIKGYVKDIESLIEKIDAKHADIDKAEIEFEEKLKDTKNVLSPFLNSRIVEAELDKMRKEHNNKQEKAKKSIEKMEKTGGKKLKKVFKPVNRLENIIKILNKIKSNTEKEIKKVEEEIKKLESEIAKAEGKEKDKLEKQLSGLNKKLLGLIKKLNGIIKQLEKYEKQKTKEVKNLKKVMASATDPYKYIGEDNQKGKEPKTETKSNPVVKQTPVTEPKTVVNQRTVSVPQPVEEPRTVVNQVLVSEPQPVVEQTPVTEQTAVVEPNPVEESNIDENYEPPVIPEVNEDELLLNNQRKKEMADEISKNVGEQLSQEQLQRAEEARKREEENKILDEIEKNQPTKEEIEKRMADELKKQQEEHTATVNLSDFDMPKELVINPDDIKKEDKKETEEVSNLPATKKNKFRIAVENVGNNIKKFFNNIRAGAKKMKESMKQAMIEILQEAQDKLENGKKENNEKSDNSEIEMSDSVGLNSKEETYRESMRATKEVQKAVEEISNNLKNQSSVAKDEKSVQEDKDQYEDEVDDAGQII